MIPLAWKGSVTCFKSVLANRDIGHVNGIGAGRMIWKMQETLYGLRTSMLAWDVDRGMMLSGLQWNVDHKSYLFGPATGNPCSQVVIELDVLGINLRSSIRRQITRDLATSCVQHKPPLTFVSQRVRWYQHVLLAVPAYNQKKSRDS